MLGEVPSSSPLALTDSPQVICDVLVAPTSNLLVPDPVREPGGWMTLVLHI